MSTFNPGKYSIHFYPPGGGVGGSYATVDEPNKPVKLYAMVPQYFDKQEWVITHGDGEGKWRIFSTFNGGVLSTTDPSAVPSGPVIAFLPGPWPVGGGVGPVIIEQNWTFSPVDADKNIYTIHPATKAVGMDYCLGHKGTDMYIQLFDIRDPSPRPQWQLNNLCASANLKPSE